MANMPSNVPPVVPVRAGDNSVPARGTSKLALLLAFAAGAAASWLIIESNDDDVPQQTTTVVAPGTTVTRSR